MKYKNDLSSNEYLEIPLGCDDKKLFLRVTVVEGNETIRLNRIDAKRHVSPGPEMDLKNIPSLVEALIKVYNDNIAKNNAKSIQNSNI